ncbi:MAG: SDR family oxidoreductase [Burkholderiales bacterium]|nr:SDR family oxidoreductase [Burkholderiales bacterium]
MKHAGYRLVLTGASGGLGQAFAAALAPRCAAMLLVGRDGARLEALRGKLAAVAPDVDARGIIADITEPAARDAVFSAAAGLPAPIDLLIHAAGINDFAPLEDQSLAVMERILAINLLAPIALTQRLLPLLLAAPRAQVVHIGSIFGYLGYPGFALYCASKFGLRGYSQALRRELADTNVSVRYFAPRAVRTALTTPAIAAMNRELGTTEDAPEAVANELVRFVGARAWDRKLGYPERLYVLMNRLVPALTDNAIRRQLAIIRKHWLRADPATATTEGESR